MTMHFGDAALFLSPLALAMLVFALVRPLARRIFIGLALAFGLVTLPLNGGADNPMTLLPYFGLSTAAGAALAEILYLVMKWWRKPTLEASE